jgi:hypothetical protein
MANSPFEIGGSREGCMRSHGQFESPYAVIDSETLRILRKKGSSLAFLLLPISDAIFSHGAAVVNEAASRVLCFPTSAEDGSLLLYSHHDCEAAKTEGHRHISRDDRLPIVGRLI